VGRVGQGGAGAWLGCKDRIRARSAALLLLLTTPHRPLPHPHPNRLFPSFSQIRAISARVAARVAAFAVERGLGSRPSGVREGAGHAEWTDYFSQHLWGAEMPLRSKL